MTYRELLEALQKLTPEQLEQEAQYVPHHWDGDMALDACPLVAIDTVENFEFEHVRSNTDHKHHPEEIVLLGDCHYFDENGNMWYDLNDLIGF